MARRRKLNIPLVKGAVMSVLGLATAFSFSLAGIGAQVAAAPMIQFLLGFTEDRIRGTALGFAMLAAVGGVIGFIVGGQHIDFGLALMLAVGATVGTVATVKAANEPRYSMVRRAGQSLGIVVAVYSFGVAMQHRIGGPLPLVPGLPAMNPLLAGLLLGILTGGISSVLQVPNGILVVPALVFLLGMAPPAAVVVSLAVIAMASFLPALSYASRGAVDGSVGTWMTVAGLAGGLGAGLVLSRVGFGSPLPLLVFAVVSMFLCAWRIWKMT